MTKSYSLAYFLLIFGCSPSMTNAEDSAAMFVEKSETQLEIGGPDDNAPYEIGLRGKWGVKEGNTISDEKGNCIVPSSVEFVGSMTLEIRMTKRSAHAEYRITGIKRSKETAAITTDSGMDWVFGFMCALLPQKTELPKPTREQLQQLAEDALKNPTPQKIYRLAQYRMQD